MARRIGMVVALSLLALSCEFDPGFWANAGTGYLEETCQGEVGTHGFGYNDVFDKTGPSSHFASDGDDVIVIANGPVTVDAGDGDDLICVTNGWTTDPGATINIIGGDGNDTIIGHGATFERCEAEVHDCDESLPTLPASPPNVIYIMTDDLGYGDLPAFHAPSPILTPNLDQMIAEGMMMTQFRSAGTVCSPTRTAVLTGRDQAYVGLRTIFSGGTTGGLHGEPETLAEMFNGAGYDTHHVGKWHLGATPAHDPITAGFQTAIRSTNFYKNFQLYTDGGLPVTNGQPNVRDPRIWEDHQTDGAHTTEVFTDETIDIIADSAAAGEPFFINLWYDAPHVETGNDVGPIPWQVPESSPLHGDPTATEQEIYIELVQVLDQQVGRIMDALDTAGVADETLLIFTSDNGGLDRASLPWTLAGLRGQKNVHYDGGLRVPFIARWPDVVPAGSTSTDFATSEDLFSTFAELVGHPPPAITQGVSLVPTLRGLQNPPAIDRIVVFEGSDMDKTSDVDDVNPYDHAIYEDGRWKYVSVAFGPTPQVGLYDVVNDPFETTNLINDPAHLQRVADLRAFYEEWSENASRATLASGGQDLGSGWSASFDGTDQVVIDTQPTIEFGNTDFTLSVDITPTAASLSSPNGVVLAEIPGAMTISITPTGTLKAVLLNSAGGTVTLAGSSQLVADVEARVSFTSRGWVGGATALRPQIGRLYLDGVREDIEEIAPAFEHVLIPGTDLEIGRGPSGDGFVGSMNSLEIHNRTLDAAQLLALA